MGLSTFLDFAPDSFAYCDYSLLDTRPVTAKESKGR